MINMNKHDFSDIIFMSCHYSCMFSDLCDTCNHFISHKLFLSSVTLTEKFFVILKKEGILL